MRCGQFSLIFSALSWLLLACEPTKSFEVAFVYPHSEDLSSELTPVEDGSRLFFTMRQDGAVLADGDFISGSLVDLENLGKPSEPWRLYFSQGTEVATKVVGSSRSWQPRPKAPVFDSVLLTPEDTLAAFAQNPNLLASTTVHAEDRWSLIAMDVSGNEVRTVTRWLKDKLVLLVQAKALEGETPYSLKLYLQRNVDLGVEELSLTEGETLAEHDALVDFQVLRQEEQATFYVEINLKAELGLVSVDQVSVDDDKSINGGKRHSTHVLLGLELAQGTRKQFAWPEEFFDDDMGAGDLAKVLLFPPFLDAVGRTSEEALALADVAEANRYPALEIDCGTSYASQGALRARYDETFLALGLSVADGDIVVADNSSLIESDGASFYVATSNDLSAAANVFRVDVPAPKADGVCDTELAPIYIDKDWNRGTEDTLLPAQAHVVRCRDGEGYDINVGFPLYAFDSVEHRALLGFDVVLSGTGTGDGETKLCSLQGILASWGELETNGLGELRLFELSP